MNQGQFSAIMDELRQQTAHLDEIRRAVNRIDSRLKSQRQIIYLPSDVDVRAYVDEYDLQDAIILPLPPLGTSAQSNNVRVSGPKQAGPTDPQAQMREMIEAKRRELAK